MDIHTDRIKDIEAILPEIALKGRHEAEKSGSSRVLTASKVSTIASLINSPKDAKK